MTKKPSSYTSLNKLGIIFLVLFCQFWSAVGLTQVNCSSIYRPASLQILSRIEDTKEIDVKLSDPFDRDGKPISLDEAYTGFYDKSETVIWKPSSRIAKLRGVQFIESIDKTNPQNWIYKSRMISKDPKTGNEVFIGYIEISIEFLRTHTRAFLNYTNIFGKFRRNNLMEVLFYKALRQFPQISKIRTHLSETNEQAVLQEFVRLLKEHPRVDLQKFDAELKALGEPAACKNQVNHLTRDDFELLAKKAIEGTPSYKIRQKLGFSKITDINFRLFDHGLTITYAVEKE